MTSKKSPKRFASVAAAPSFSVFGRIGLIADATPAAEQASETFKEINRSTDSKNSHRGVETEPPTRKEQTEMLEQIFIEKWARFLLVDGKWDVQTWPDQVTAGCKLYRLRIPVPAELIGGQVVAEVADDTGS